MQAVCLGGGPSLTPEDVALCSGTFTIAINNAVDLAPWAEVCYAADYQWWDRRQGFPDFQGWRVGMYPFNKMRYPNVVVFESGGDTGLSTSPHTLCTGRNSGYSAIDLAVKFGATEILLLGYDMQPDGDRHHWHEPHPGDRHPSYARDILYFDTLVSPLTARGVTVYNCSRRTSLATFQRADLCERLSRRGSQSLSSRGDTKLARGGE